MALALSADPIDEAADKSVRWVDRILMCVFVACVIAMIAYGVYQLFS